MRVEIEAVVTVPDDLENPEKAAWERLRDIVDMDKPWWGDQWDEETEYLRIIAPVVDKLK